MHSESRMDGPVDERDSGEPAVWRVAELRVGRVVEVVLGPNPRRASAWPLVSRALDGRPSGKLVVCADAGVPEGVPVSMRIRSVRHRGRGDRGHVEVAPLEGGVPDRDGVWVPEVLERQLRVLLGCGTPVLLRGPQGSGKTTIVRAMAHRLRMRFVYFNCASVSEPDDFLATLHLEVAEGGSRTRWVPTPLLAALREAAQAPERPVLVFLDELNRCPEGARNVLMPALDSTRQLHDPTVNGALAIPANVVFVAAVNAGQGFSGTWGIDAAQLDRFVSLELGWPPQGVEVALLRRRFPGVRRQVLEQVVGLAHALRTAEGLQPAISVRATEQTVQMLAHQAYEALSGPAALREVARTTLCGRFPGHPDQRGTQAALAWQLVCAELERMGG